MRFRDKRNLRMWLKVNGTFRQYSSTREMIFDVSSLVSYVSQFMTLLPRDIISTGTLAGVGLGIDSANTLKLETWWSSVSTSSASRAKCSWHGNQREPCSDDSAFQAAIRLLKLPRRRSWGFVFRSLSLRLTGQSVSSTNI